MKVLLVDLGTPRDEISEPLGIETLAPYITDNVPEAQIYLKSLELDNYSDIGPILKNSHYEIIGLSTKIRAYEKFKTSVEKTQEESPDTILVAGDILGTYAFEDVLKLYNNIICVRGEGETAFSELVKEVAQNKKRENLKLTNIPNLAYISNNELVLTERESFDIRNAKHPLRSLAYKVFDQNGCSRIEGSRGCAYSLCSYCGTVEKYNGPGWKPFDITFVLEELSSLSNIGFKSPWFTDEDFFGDNPKRVEEFAKVLIEYKKDGIINPNLDFYINARVDSVLGVDFGGKKESEKILTKLKKSGLREIFLGLESGCKNQLRRYRKFGIGQKNIEALNFLRGLGIETDIGFIFFDQSVSVSELRENLNFIYDAGINNHDARLIKRVRIEPRTPLGNDFSTKNQEVRIDLDSVEYEYEFDDPDVEEIFNTFRSWELGDLDVIYNLQAFCRGEIPEGYTRKEIKNIISKYRQLDCEYLNDILKVYENDKGETGKFIEEITNKYKTIRDTMDETLIDRVKWLDSTFRRNV